MGIFSSKKKIYVSAVAYNLAGEEEDRVDFVKYNVLNSTLQNQSITKNLTSGIINGAGMHIKSAHNYARDHYTYGVPNSNALETGSVPADLLVPVLASLHAGLDISVLTGYICPADYEFWAEQYLAEQYGYDRTTAVFGNPPAGAVYNADPSYDFADGVIKFVLMNPDMTTVKFNYTPVNFLSGRMYVQSAYKTRHELAPVTTTTSRPALAGELDSTQTVLLTTTIADEVHYKTTTTVTTITGVTAHDTSTVTEVIYSRALYFTYLLKSGTYPTLDALLDIVPLSVPYYPAVPLRVNNVDFTDEAHQGTDLYKTSKKLLKKCGAKIEDLADKLNDNEKIKDIDFAFVVFGVCVRSQTEAGKRYLYQFFEHLDGMGSVTQAQFDTWNALPALIKRKTAPPTNNLLIYDSEDRANNYDVKIQWQYISKTLVHGTIHAGANIGDVDSSMGGEQLHELEQNSTYSDMLVDHSNLYLRRQISATSFEILTVSGLVFQNFIYKGKAVELTAHQAFTDPDPEVGDGFILPLNRDILRSLGGRWMTQLGQECTYLVLNCYTVVKIKWYQRGWFKILLIIVAIVITVLSYGTSGPEAAGFLSGIGASVGVTLGLSGLLLSVFAASFSVLTTMVLMQILTPALVQTFGEKWGRVLAVVASIAIAGGFSSANLKNLANLSVPKLILSTSSTASQLYGAYAQGEALGLAADSAKATSLYKNEMKHIQDLMKEFLKSSNLLDIQGFLETSELAVTEGPSTFLSRTLLTGSDIVEISHGIVNDFADFSLDLRTSTG